MDIEIVDNGNKLVTTLELESCPFVVGQIIYLDIQNYDNIFWNNDFHQTRRGKFKVLNIEHFVKKKYLSNENNKTFFTVSVTVEEVEE